VAQERKQDRMRDEDKTREQLIGELVELRRRVAELESNSQRLEELLWGIRIGDILVEMGYLTMAELRKALEKQKEADARLGRSLVETGVITEEQLRTALREQIKRFQRHFEDNG
jgi:hypothetical protein